MVGPGLSGRGPTHDTTLYGIYTCIMYDASCPVLSTYTVRQQHSYMYSRITTWVLTW